MFIRIKLNFCFPPVLLLCCIVIWGEAAAQEKQQHSIVSGKVLDSVSREPVAYATIQVTSENSSHLPATVTGYSDQNGKFEIGSLQKGSYVMKLSFVGLVSRTIPFSIKENDSLAGLGTIFLWPDKSLLKGVTVTATRKLVEQKPGMLVYNAENDITNLGGTAADVLRKAPVLNVDADGNVMMRGSGNIKILINGRYSGQIARNAADALNMMPSDIIKSVEIITSPSSRYDAEGAAGVINIITKKNINKFSGALELVAGNLDQVLNPRAGLSAGRWNINGYAHLHRSRDKKHHSMKRMPEDGIAGQDELTQSSGSDNIRPHGSTDVTVDYEPDSSRLLSIAVGAWLGNWPVNSLQDNTLIQSGQTQSYQQEVFTRAAPNTGIDVSGSYTKRFKKAGQSFFIIGQYSNNFKDDFNYDAWQRNDQKQLIYQEKNDNHMQTREWTLQSDYSYPFGNSGRHLLETGVKGIYRDVVSAYQTLASAPQNAEILLPQPDRSDEFDYSQGIVAGYLLTKLKLNKGWFLQPGARFEQTFVKGHFASASSSFRNGFSNFVPGLTVEKTWGKDNTVAASYTQRISRPSIIDLNPNVDARDAKNLVIGNPDLRPETMHQAELSYATTTTSGVFLYTALFWKQTNNSIEDVISIDKVTNVSTVTKQNLAANRQYGINFSTTFNLLPGWTAGSNATFNYLRFHSRYLNISTEGWGGGVNVNTTYKLPANYAVQLFGDYDSRVITLQGYKSNWFYYSAAVKKEFPEKRITIGVATVNPFSESAVRKEQVNTSGYSSWISNRYYNRAVKFTLNWKFGQTGKQINRKTVNNDDVKQSNER